MLDKNTFGDSPAAETLIKLIIDKTESRKILSKVSRVLERYSRIVNLVGSTDFHLGDYVLKLALKSELKIVDGWSEEEVKSYTKNLLDAKYKNWFHKNKK